MSDQSPPNSKSKKKKEKKVSPIQMLRSLSRQLPTFSDFERLGFDMGIGHDGATAILLASQLERLLEHVLAHKLNIPEAKRAALFEPEGPLPTFGGKVMLAYAIGLVDENTKREMNIIRQIRNAFAHTPNSINFSTPEIVAVCEPLARYLEETIPAEHLPLKGLAAVLLNAPPNKQRQAYLNACMAICRRLLEP